MLVPGLLIIDLVDVVPQAILRGRLEIEGRNVSSPKAPVECD